MNETEARWLHQQVTPDDAATLDEVRAFVSAKNGHYKQQPPPSGLESNQTLWVTRKNGALDASALLDIRRSKIPGVQEWVAARGPVYSSEAALHALLDTLVETGKRSAVCLRINPFIEFKGDSPLPNGWNATENSADYADTLVCQVESDTETQWRTLRRSTRTAINRARKADLEIRTRTATEDFQGFGSAFRIFANDRGIASIPQCELTRAHSFANNSPAHAFLLSAELDEEVLGQMLLLRCGQGLVYEHGWMANSAKSRKIPVMHLLLWEALEIARQAGMAELDLGGYWVERGNDDPINHFKLGFSKTVRHYLPAHQQVFAPVRFALLTAMRKLRQ